MTSCRSCQLMLPISVTRSTHLHFCARALRNAIDCKQVSFTNIINHLMNINYVSQMTSMITDSSGIPPLVMHAPVDTRRLFISHQRMGTRLLTHHCKGLADTYSMTNSKWEINVRTRSSRAKIRNRMSSIII